MTIAGIPKNLDEGSREVSSFLATKKSNDKLDVLRGIQSELSQAIERPDSLPSAAPRLVEAAHPQVDEDDVGAGPSYSARPSSKKPKLLEKTFSIDPEQHRKLLRFSNMEGLRLDANVSVSEIIRHLLDFALAHVDERKGEVLPSRDGKGLKIPSRRA